MTDRPDRPELSDLAADAQPAAYGIVFDERYSYDDRRDWEGPFETPEAAREALEQKGLELEPFDEEDDDFEPEGKVVPWNARQLQLARVMDEHRIHPNQDYGFEDLMEALAGEREVPRYGAIRHDETYTIVALCETAEEAAKDLSSSATEETLNTPLGVIDLDSGKMARPEVSVGLSFE